MSIIKILSEKLINQIAAGEVIERPASVVKELIENSIDAGADQIIIEAKDGGKTFIKITDNGCGMERDDAEKSLLRHATSKISEEKDLWNISTMGFRGEALASILSVSQMILQTKTKDSNSGTEITCDGGEIKTVQDCGMKDGTSVEVNNLFFNTPARANYLKKDSTELSNIIFVVNNIALAHPEIAFKFIHNGKNHFDLPKTTDLKRRISDIFGKATSDAMIPIFYGGSDFKLNGFIGKPVISRSDSRHQYIFVNKRPIQNHLIAYKIKEAFHSMLLSGKKPVFIINIEIDPSLIDVNVHPRKLEIRFEDESKILKTVYGASKVSLESNNLIPKAFTESQRYMSDKFPSSERAHGGFLESGSAGSDSAGSGSEWQNRGESGIRHSRDYNPDASEFTVPDAINFTKAFCEKDFGKERTQGAFDLGSNENSSLKAITKVANCYIVAQDEKGLILVDQHAAHERVRYFELLNQFESQNKNIQPLLMPENLELTFDEVEILKANMDFFEKLGFEIETGPLNTLTVFAVPAIFSSEDISEIIKGVLDDIINEKNPAKMQGKKESIIHYMACRSAIKFGKKLSIDEMNSLLVQMKKIDKPYTCPHGRPTMIALTFDELQRMFGRK